MNELPVVRNGLDSDYIIFADESGDHSLTSINQDYPIFVLCFCIVEKKYYIEYVVPEIHKIKMRYFGHDQIIFHEREFVRRIGKFGALSKDDQTALLCELGLFVESADITITAAVIHKNSLAKKYDTPFNPYHLGLQFCMERTHDFLCDKQQQNKRTHIIAESRGKKEDILLKEEFKHIMNGKRGWSKWFSTDFEETPLSLFCSPKGANSSGLQLADLTARPIGLSKLRPDQNNRAFDIIKEKIWEIKEFP